MNCNHALLILFVALQSIGVTFGEAPKIIASAVEQSSCWNFIRDISSLSPAAKAFKMAALANEESFTAQKRILVSPLGQRSLVTLRGFGNCGSAAKISQAFAMGLGCQSVAYKSLQLPTMSRFFSTPDHIFSVVTIDGEELLFDSAYIQFLKAIDLFDEYLPKESVLVLPYRDRGLITDEAAKLWHRLRADPTAWHHKFDHAPFYQPNVTENDVRRSFDEVWDFKAPFYSRDH